jgi:uncharacterized glyoxalase superfamily protein PhnB
MQRSPVTPSLYTPDISKTVDFYVKNLGFEQTAVYRDDNGVEIWTEVALDESRLWFFSNPLEQQPGPAFSGLIYIFVQDVDALSAHLQDNVSFEWGPETQDYGLRELGLRDINGYYIVFAHDV